MQGEGSRIVLAIIAALNEEEGIAATIGELRDYLEKPWVLVVDGKSRDGTVEAARSMHAEVIHQEGKGKGNAIAQAIEHVDFNADYIVFIDADYTYPAKYLPEMINILEKNPRVGMTCGNRFNAHFHLTSMRNMFYLGNRLLAFAHNLLNGVDMRDPLTGLRVVRWNILKEWRPKSNGFDIEVELNHLIENAGFDIVEIPIHYRPRLGEKKLKARHGLTILKRILAESM